MQQVRELIFYKHYFKTFFENQTKATKEKIDYVLFVLTHADRVPEKFFKHLEGTKGLYEIRVESGKNIFRIFCCFDKGRIIVIFNGFQKKSQKTPVQEIDMALGIMKEYFEKKTRDEKG